MIVLSGGTSVQERSPSGPVPPLAATEWRLRCEPKNATGPANSSMNRRRACQRSLLILTTISVTTSRHSYNLFKARLRSRAKLTLSSSTARKKLGLSTSRQEGLPTPQDVCWQPLDPFYANPNRHASWLESAISPSQKWLTITEIGSWNPVRTLQSV